MSWTFIFFIIVAILAGLAWIGRGTATPGTKDHKAITSVAKVASLAALGLLFLASFTIVGTKSVAIETWFNKPVGTADNGWTWHAPWAELHEWDGKLQNLRYSDSDDPGVEEDGKGVAVRLGNQGTATVDLIFQYRITDSGGTLDLFRNYGDEKSVRNNAARKALQSAVNQAFADFDPIKALAQTTDRSPTVGMPQLGQEALGLLRNGGLPAGLEAVSLTIVMPHYDGQTEGRIQAFNAAVGDTAIATQREETAKAIQRANAILAASDASPEVLYQNCLDMVERVVKAGKALPPAFSCSGGGGVVIPASSR